MSPGGNHTLAIINGTEKLNTLKTALADIIKEVSELKTLSVDQNKFEIEPMSSASIGKTFCK